jgi:hypothetical protein
LHLNRLVKLFVGCCGCISLVNTLVFICGNKNPRLQIHFSCILWLEITAVEILRSPCDTIVLVVTQVMGARYKARPVTELVTQMAGDMLCQKLSSRKTDSIIRSCVLPFRMLARSIFYFQYKDVFISWRVTLFHVVSLHNLWWCPCFQPFHWQSNGSAVIFS